MGKENLQIVTLSSPLPTLDGQSARERSSEHNSSISLFSQGTTANLDHLGQVGSRGGGLLQLSLLDVVENYVEYYAAGKGHTARAKRYDLQHFLEFLAKSRPLSVLKLADWTYGATNAFVTSRLEDGEAPSTVARRLATLKHFGRTLGERVPGFVNPAREVKSPSVSQSVPHGMTAREIAALRTTALSMLQEKPTFRRLRDYALLEVLLATGLRADEARTITISQLSQDLDWIRSVKTKGRKYRNVYLDSSVRELLREYLGTRKQELRTSFPNLQQLPVKHRAKLPVFVSLRGAELQDPDSFRLDPKTLWRIICEFGRRARIENGIDCPNLHPHLLRHTFAHGLLSSSLDIRLVAQALGHSDVRTTMRYTERRDEEIAAAIEEKRLNEDR